MPIDFWEIHTIVRKIENEALAIRGENEKLKQKITGLEAELKALKEKKDERNPGKK